MFHSPNLQRHFEKCLTIAIAVVGTFSLSLCCTQAKLGDYDDLIENRWTAPQRVLIFPGDISLGTIIIQADWNNRESRSPVKSVAAHGKIVVPKNLFVTLKANIEFFKHPDLVSKLPPNAIDCLQLKLMSMDDSEDTLCDQALVSVAHLTGIRVLLLDKSEVTDQGMKAVARLKNLEYISAFLTSLRGTFLKDLIGLKKLRALDLSSVSLSEEGIKYLPQYPSLQILIARRSAVTDSAMKYIGACTRLTVLDIGKNPAIGDASIPYIKQLKSLKTLILYETGISADGLLKLKGQALQKLGLTKSKYTAAQITALRLAFPQASLLLRGEGSTVDEYNGTIFGQMSRQRKL